MAAFAPGASVLSARRVDWYGKDVGRNEPTCSCAGADVAADDGCERIRCESSQGRLALLWHLCDVDPAAPQLSGGAGASSQTGFRENGQARENFQ